MAKKNNIGKSDLEHVLEQLTEQQLRAFVKKQLAENNDLKVAFAKDFQKYFIKRLRLIRISAK